MNNSAIQAETIVDGIYRLPLPSDTLPPFDHTNSYLIVSRGVGVLVMRAVKKRVV